MGVMILLTTLFLQIDDSDVEDTGYASYDEAAPAKKGDHDDVDRGYVSMDECAGRQVTQKGKRARNTKTPQRVSTISLTMWTGGMSVWTNAPADRSHRRARMPGKQRLRIK